MTKLVIVGCGGFGREVHDVVDALVANGANLQLIGYVDDNPTVEADRLVARRGARILGPRSWFQSADKDVRYVVGVGQGKICRLLDVELSALGFEPHSLVHPDTTLGFDVDISPGVIICAGARLTTNVRVGRHVHIDRNCVVGHDSRLDDYAIMYPMSTLSGGVTLGVGSLLGAASTVLQNLNIGSDVIVGAGAVVTSDLPNCVTVRGVPARSVVK